MKLIRIVIGLVLLLGWTVATTSSAAAAAPSNDTVAGATPLTMGIPSRVDTTDATTDSIELGLAAQCYLWNPPKTGVWYSYQATTSGTVSLNTQLDGSANYQMGIIVATGDPAALTRVSCSSGPSAQWTASAGTSYFLFVYDGSTGGQNHGQLGVLLSDSSTKSTVTVQVNPSATISTPGRITLTGTSQCTGALSGDASLDVTQKSGRSYTTGEASFRFTCDGTSQPWSVTILGNAPFVGGKALVTGQANAINPFTNVWIPEMFDSTITLKGGNAR